MSNQNKHSGAGGAALLLEPVSRRWIPVSWSVLLQRSIASLRACVILRLGATLRRHGGNAMMERVLSWALGITLAVLLLIVVYQALTGPTPNAIFGMIALRSGLHAVEPYGRYLVCGLQLLAAVLAIVPATRRRGAWLALVLSLTAIMLHLSPWLGLQLPQGAAVSQALVQGRSLADINAMGLPTDKGAMFLLAVAIAILSISSIFLERAKIEAAARGKVKKPIGAFA